MWKTRRIILMVLVVLSASLSYSHAQSDGIPPWVTTVNAHVSAALQTSIKLQFADGYDPVHKETFRGYRLSGQGSLKAVPDPFKSVREVFSTDKGWKEDPRYAGDGHGSTSFAFRKGPQLCMASVWIDSDCEDIKTGHVPSLFWFCVDCRDIHSRIPRKGLNNKGRTKE